MDAGAAGTFKFKDVDAHYFNMQENAGNCSSFLLEWNTFMVSRKSLHCLFSLYTDKVFRFAFHNSLGADLEIILLL